MRLPFLLVVATACGSPQPTTTDAAASLDAPAADTALVDSSPVDAAADAAAVDAGPDNITVTVFDDFYPNQPLAGYRVAFVEANGALSAEVTTGADGIARARISPDASISVAVDNGIETLLGVQPGDDIHMGVYQAWHTPIVGSLSLSFTAAPGPAPAAYYTMTSCPASALGASPVDLLVDGCTNGPQDVAVYAVDGQKNILHYLDAPAVTMTAGGTFAMPDAWQAPTTFTATYGGVPAGELTQVRIWYTDSRQFETAPTIAISATATTTLTTQIVPGGPAWLDSRIYRKEGSLTSLHDPIDGDLAAYNLDVGQLLPAIERTTYDPATGHIALVPSTGNASLVTFAIRYFHPNENLRAWRIIGLPTTSLTLPPLPADFDAPRVGDTIHMMSTLAEAPELHDYASFRKQPLDVYEKLGLGTTDPVLRERVQMSIDSW